ncbi:hypothetical protein ONE63_011228 [Megalurothrips usitatus]|uniref:Gustatory receptor n=1 Tax=Megalurothrips usitatus TaxID=439358 RepID=A0AAV7X405_9NEOP|nr:hypothetical protein ONE63_011228 [Megalurothrips usitatus]
MPMIWMLRLFLMLPVSITTSDTFRFRWRSSIMVATFGTWTLLVVVAYYAVRYRIDPLIDTTKHFHLWDTVPKYASAVNFCYIFFMPFTCWTTADRAVAFVEYWSIFEAEMRAALQARVSLARVTRRAWCWCAAGVGLPLLLVILSLFTLPGEVLWLSPVLLHSFVFMTLGNAFWLLCCSTFARVADYQAGRLRSDLRRLGMRGLRAHRSIWQGMARTLDMMSASWGRTQMLLLAISFVNLTSIAFLFTHFIVDNVWESPVSWLATLMLLSAISIIAICNSAHVATSGVRNPTILTQPIRVRG